MSLIVQKIENSHKKSRVVEVRSGDTVRVHQKIREGNKERIQMFEGLVIRTKRMNSHTASITVRRLSGGIGVEKSYLLHSPLVTKVEVVKRSKVRRNYLSYMRQRTGKAARLVGVDFDREAINDVRDEQAEAEEAKLREQAAKEAEDKAEEKAKEEAANEAKAEAALAQHEKAAEPESKDSANTKPPQAKAKKTDSK